MSITKSHHALDVDAQTFREVVSHFLSGVTVITTEESNVRYGVTASAVSSLSLDPPMLLVCLNQKLATADAIARSGHFAVNILAAEHAPWAAQFAMPHDDKFRDVEVHCGARGMPLLTKALAHIECELHDAVCAGTHTILIGRVRAAQATAGKPLAYFRGQFGQFVQV